MKRHKQVFEAIKRATGKDVADIGDWDESWFFINGAVMTITPPAWEKPGEVEAQLEGVLRDIRSLRRRIDGLDKFALTLARKAQTSEEDCLFEERIIRAEGDFGAVNRLIAEHQMSSPSPSEYVDRAALMHIEALENCLVAPIERAIAMAPVGRGRPRNRRAYAVAEFAAQCFVKLT